VRNESKYLYVYPDSLHWINRTTSLLSKKENKWVGFILPAISFIGFSMLIVSESIYINTMLYSTIVDGETVIQTVSQMSSTGANIGRYVYIFFLWNIPTILLLAIYFACRSKRNKQRALEKMSIQDLE